MTGTKSVGVNGMLVDEPGSRPAWFDRELVACLPKLRRQARKLCASEPAGAEDLVNDTMLCMLRRYSTYRREAGPMVRWGLWWMRSCNRQRAQRYKRVLRVEDKTARIADKPQSADEPGRIVIPAVAASQDNVVQLKQMLAVLDGVKYAGELIDVALGGDLTEIAEARGLASRQTVFQRASSARRAVSHKLKLVPNVDIAA